MFFWNSLAFSMIQRMLAIWSLVPQPFLKPAWISLEIHSSPIAEAWLEEFPTVKGFSIVSEVEVDIFLEFPCFFYDPTDVGNLFSRSSAFSKSSLNIWKFSVHILLKPHLENFEHYLASMWDECNFVIVWTFFVLAFLCDWSENWPFPVLLSLMRVPNLGAYWVQHLNSIIF